MTTTNAAQRATMSLLHGVKVMKSLKLVVLAGLIGVSAGCDEFLDVNDNPNAPETVSANLYLAPMLHWMVMSPQWDGRFIGQYTEQWVQPQTSGPTPNVWVQMGYQRGSDNGAQQWRDVYWTLGQNLVDLMTLAEAEQRWDVLGVGYVMKAWGWLALTSIHGEIIIDEAFDVTRFTFDYDSQEHAYDEVQRLLDLAIANLQRTDGAVDASYLAVGDKIYNGDRTKWLKVAYGLKAMALNHFSNKASYDPAAVIAAVDQSFTSGADDALFLYPSVSTDNQDRNFWGRTRGNLTAEAYRQTKFVLELMNGTQFGGVMDPRMTRMLAPSPDGQYRGIDPDIGFVGLAASEIPNNLHGYAGTGGVGEPGRYIFDDKARVPFMTYSQLQFVKAEAALKLNNQGVAIMAYQNAISSHIDFVNARSSETANPALTQITAAEKSAFLAAITPATLTLSHVMSQKFIAQWAWGHDELWMDMRRYDYTDMDPVSGTQVFRGFTIPTLLDPDNGGKPVERLRPRYNSEYVWNQAGLSVIGGLALDYHTKPMWITEQ